MSYIPVLTIRSSLSSPTLLTAIQPYDHVVVHEQCNRPCQLASQAGGHQRECHHWPQSLGIRCFECESPPQIIQMSELTSSPLRSSSSRSSSSSFSPKASATSSPSPDSQKSSPKSWVASSSGLPSWAGSPISLQQSSQRHPWRASTLSLLLDSSCSSF
jgi:hypothetical protein